MTTWCTAAHCLQPQLPGKTLYLMPLLDKEKFWKRNNKERAIWRIYQLKAEGLGTTLEVGSSKRTALVQSGSHLVTYVLVEFHRANGWNQAFSPPLEGKQTVSLAWDCMTYICLPGADVQCRTFSCIYEETSWQWHPSRTNAKAAKVIQPSLLQTPSPPRKLPRKSPRKLIYIPGLSFTIPAPTHCITKTT